MLTKEQVVKYLIKVDLGIRNVDHELTPEGYSTLIRLCIDPDIRDVEMKDVLEYIHDLEAKLENRN